MPHINLGGLATKLGRFYPERGGPPKLGLYLYTADVGGGVGASPVVARPSPRKTPTKTLTSSLSIRLNSQLPQPSKRGARACPPCLATPARMRSLRALARLHRPYASVAPPLSL